MDREYSLDNVIVDSAGGDDANGNYEGFVTELKISTATPKHYNAGYLAISINQFFFTVLLCANQLY